MTPMRIIVAVHGIGDQLRCATVQSLSKRMGLHCEPHLPLLPLGHFNTGAAPTIAQLLPRQDWDQSDPRSTMYFGEAYWANIPRGVVKEAETLEEAKAWATTVVSRARSLYGRVHGQHVTVQVNDEFRRAAGVVQEFVEGVGVLERLLSVLDKAGVFKYDLGNVLRQYVGDVQLVADFEAYRNQIVKAFQDTLAALDQCAWKAAIEQAAGHGWCDERRDRWFDQRRIYIVAHSEGTVVALLGLLWALAGKPIGATGAGDKSQVPNWAARVRGFMTFGSPIDKHLALWTRMWKGLRDIPPQGPHIQWRNYYDLGDPIGFELDTAREWMKANEITCFQFDGSKDDIGFARYLLPGKAHGDYWNDEAVFGHFFEEVVLSNNGAKPPASKGWVEPIAPLLPYALSFAIQTLGVYLLCKAVLDWLHPKAVDMAVLVFNVAAWSVLLCTVTFAARLPRLVSGHERLWRSWHATAAMVAGAVVSLLLGAVSGPVPACEPTCLPLAGVSHEGGWYLTGPDWPRFVVALLGALVTVLAWLARVSARQGRTLLLGAGLGIVGLVVAWLLYQAPCRPETPPLWPVVLGMAAFFYAWWLGIVTFDLAFLWQTYVRGSTATKALHRWKAKELPVRSPQASAA